MKLPGATHFVVLCANQEQAQKALNQISQWVEENGLKLHPTKTRLVDASQRGGFDFLGYHFERAKKWPRKKSLDKLKDTIRSKTRRSNGSNNKAICSELNRTLKGWFGYFKHSAPHVHEPIDGYVRGRLRSILRHQRKRKGRARLEQYRQIDLTPNRLARYVSGLSDSQNAPRLERFCHVTILLYKAVIL